MDNQKPKTQSPYLNVIRKLPEKEIVDMLKTLLKSDDEVSATKPDQEKTKSDPRFKKH